ncbi:MAG: trimethylamine methyltransferase family protein [Anaerolineae bacterium]|nr:trimethylamine methyltransferase family protein [Anaerolineae bacterium]MDW8070213.1 trimethylamine methyltransferase family protein [Anaerolineae bacterium]
MARIQLQFLSDEEKQHIHSAALDLLDKIGLRIVDAEARAILADAGAHVDSNMQRVRFPVPLVESARQKVPSEFTLYGRDPQDQKHVVHLKPGNVYYSTNGYAVHWYDPQSETRRPITQEDLAWITRLADAQEQLDIMATIGTPVDAPAETNDRYQQVISLLNSTRPVLNTAYGKSGVRDNVEIATIVRGSREALRQYPLWVVDLTTLSPMELDERQASAMVEAARQGVPIGISPGPIAGATGPVTLAGNTAMATAELLGAITLVQTVQPGTPVLYTSYTRSLDMSSGQLAMGGPEFALQRIATAEMARYFNIPSRGGGLITDAKAVDAQLGVEKLLGCLLPSLAGLTVVAGFGMVDTLNTVRPEVFLIDNEIVSVVRHTLKSFEVNEDTIPHDLIAEVGPGGNFLTAPHTLEHFKRELWFTRLWERRAWEVWEREGRLDVAQRAWKMIGSRTYAVPPLEQQVVQAMWEVVRAADRDLARS